MSTKSEIELAQKEVSDNYKFFKKMLPKWREESPSGFVLIHHQELVGVYENLNDAVQTGIKRHGLGNFSVQSMQQNPIDLGHQSNALF